MGDADLFFCVPCFLICQGKSVWCILTDMDIAGSKPITFGSIKKFTAISNNSHQPSVLSVDSMDNQI